MYGDLPPSAYSRIPPEAPTHPEPGHVPYRQHSDRRRWLVPAVAGLLAAFAVAAVMQLIGDDGGHTGADAATRTSTRTSPTTSTGTKAPAPAAPLPSPPATASPTPTSASPTPSSKPHHHQHHGRAHHHHGAAAPTPAPRPRQARPHAHRPHHHARPRHRPAGWVRTECRRRYHDAAHIAACQAALGGMFR